ncbi:MAG: hypothetical protein PHV75_01820 [Victivallaceae bacterium]|nr:hypothetical protein [Victivallaceae bacterium]MDD3116199.1 hypothetical protein [Victivallaceae bacterium]MDD3704435.1 hypothetical protein [Victivallaceae bacterium]MDD4317235.1 hypothetical protein [Victivallaceae bacterium]MDD5663209.1 hypothetical protein [Victivallaceae bacterium]
MKLGFFRILVETCRGTNIFFHLLRQPVLTAFFHFFLLSVLCSAGVALFSSLSLSKMVDSGIAKVRESCGNISLGKNGLVPEKSPDISRLIFAESRLELVYIADPFSGVPDFDQGIANAGILWSPRFIAVWGRAGEGEYVMIPALSTQKYIPKMKVLTRSEVNDYIKSGSNSETLNISTFDLNTLAQEIKIIASIILFIMMFIQLFLVFVFFIITTTATRAFLGGSPLRERISFRDYLVLALYVAFPCMIITGVVAVINVSFISLPLTALILFMIYFLYVAYRIERWVLSLNTSSQNDIGD